MGGAGLGGAIGAGAGAGGAVGMTNQEQAMVKMVGGLHCFAGPVEHETDREDTTQVQAAMESCPFKSVISGTMGFALGGAFGLFMASVRTSATLVSGLSSTLFANRSGGLGL